MASIHVGGKSIPLVLPKTDKNISSVLPGQKYGPAIVHAVLEASVGTPNISPDGFSVSNINVFRLAESNVTFDITKKTAVEVTPTLLPNDFAMIGVVKESDTNKSLEHGILWFCQSTGHLYNYGAFEGVNKTYGLNDVVGIVFDGPSKTIDFYRNGTFQFSKIFTDNENFYLKLGSGTSSDTLLTSYSVNFGQTPFAHTYPGAETGLYQ